jgi:hypothetical protein
MHTQVYAYAQKPPAIPMIDQLLVREVAHEIRAARNQLAIKPTWIAVGPVHSPGRPQGYKNQLSTPQWEVMS